ncbi:hypothetical protein [Heyndrickxia sporothermodurans]|uniref:hypothetical protein n=1 Tax=Heyndrickxia sporothermodurans TaxID=46224 RepID=UPI000D3B1ADB|nr:hypothetical protein [Heyndrickxia sporothermodurans]PTY89741.1 hypothetical protein B5V90_07430 [Heyndrickxia sporothermodurans]
MATFFRKMIEEKELLNEVILVEHHGFQHFIEVSFLLEIIENANEKEKVQIKNTFSVIDFKNGNLMHYLNFLAEAYISKNY